MHVLTVEIEMLLKASVPALRKQHILAILAPPISPQPTNFIYMVYNA